MQKTLPKRVKSVRASTSKLSLIILAVIVLGLLVGGGLWWHHQPTPAATTTMTMVKTTDPIEAFYQKVLQYKRVPAVSALEHIEQQVNAKQLLDSQDYYSAKYALMRVLAENPDDFQTWFLLYKTLYELQRDSLPSAEEKADLAAVYNKVNQLAQNEEDKAALIAIKDPLTLNTHTQRVAIQTRLSALLNIYPTQFAPYFLDLPQQTEIGTACVSWTFPLLKQRNFHFENYVTLTPAVKDLGVIARGNQLCVEGLQFGENYTLRFKPGFAGEHNAKLEKEYTVDLFIPHRQPSIRFRERGYILSSFGPQVVPFVAVNVSSVLVKIIHIPERNIHSVQGNWFNNQINRWEMSNLSKEQGEVLWQGTYQFPNELDKTGVSGLPIDTLLGKKLAAGVYIIDARISEESYKANEFSSQALIVSDIGLSTYNGPDGLHVLARDLSSAKILKDVELRLIAKNNRELGKAQTQANGFAHFPDTLLNGQDGNAPAFLTATLLDKQFTVLNLANEAFDLSDRGVEGREYTGAVEGVIYAERGIYRPGETVHLLSLLRNAHGEAIKNLPLTLRLRRPDGVLVTDIVLKDAGGGAYQWDYAMNTAAPTGEWTAAIYIDPKAKEIGNTTFEVQDFVPPRIEVKATPAHNSVKPFEENTITVDAQYYFGAPGANLKVEAQSTLIESQNIFNNWPGYQFGLTEEKWTPLRFKHENAQTDEQGVATLTTQVDVQPQTSHLLTLQTTCTVLEAGGRGRMTTVTTPLWHQPFAIGIKPHFEDNSTASDTQAVFDIIALNQQGELQNAEGVMYTLFTEQHDFIWFRSGNQWQYENVVRDKVASTGKIMLNNKTPAVLKVPVTSGSYRLEMINEKTGVASSLRFSAGWGYVENAPNRPDVLEIDTQNGQIMIKSPFAGEILIALAGEKFRPVYTGTVTTGENKIPLPLKDQDIENGGSYLLATVYRPANASIAQMPGRAIGVKWLENTQSLQQHQLNFKIEAPKEVKSNSTFTVDIQLPTSKNKTYVNMALVDEGTLSLTHYETPSPFDYFFAQKSLSFALRDSYGLFINPYGAKPGSFEVGAGEDASSFSNKGLMQLPGKAYKVVSLYSGIIEADKNQQTLSVPFTVPEYTGKLRLMAIAWNDVGIGSAQESILVQDEIDVSLALPRFLAPNDTASTPLTLNNIKGEEGEYTLEIKTGNKTAYQKIVLKKGQALQVPLTLHFEQEGIQSIQIHIQGPQGYTLSRNWEISVRPKTQRWSTQQFGSLQPEATLELSSSLFTLFAPSTTQAVLAVGAVPDFGKQQLIKELIAYPYLCLEQTTSRLFAMLNSENSDKQNMTPAFNQLSALQKLDGSFGLWTSAGPTEYWLTLYAADIFQLMQQHKEMVPEALTKNLQRWMSELSNNTTSKQTIGLQSYANYVLAKAGKNSIGELRYFAQTHQNQITLKRDLAFIAAAFAYYGEAKLAYTWFDKAIHSEQYDDKDNALYFGTPLRDDAILVALLAETTKNHPQLAALSHALSAKANDAHYLSTQEKAWLIRAANGIATGEKPRYQYYAAQDVKNTPTYKNTGSTPVFYALSVEGEPKDVHALPQQGFEINRTLYTLEGQPVDEKKLQAGERYVVMLKAQRLNNDLQHILLVDRLPGGFEIENPNLLNKPLSNDFPWIGDVTPARRLEGRDDRLVGAYALHQQEDIVVAYIVRAVTQGKFVYPSPYIEAMYQPQNFAFGQEQVIHIGA